MDELNGFSQIVRIGSQGAVEVFKALDVHTQKLVLMKRLPRQSARTHHLNSFLNQYEILKLFPHFPALKPIRILDETDYHAIIFEYFQGESIQSSLVKSDQVDSILSVFIQVIQQLSIIHESGVVHRNLLPDYILWDAQNNEVKLDGFQYAISQDALPQSALFLQASDLMWNYISPEQTGRTNRAVDYRSDFYAFGCLLYEYLTGCRPYSGTSPEEVIAQVISRDPLKLKDINPHIPTCLESVVTKLMSKDPDDRYQSHYGIIQDLNTCLNIIKLNQKNVVFNAGKQDVPRKFRMPQKLLGRMTEAHQLSQMLSLSKQGFSTFVLVEGVSGVGKTSLVQETFRYLKYGKANYVMGKYQPFSKNVPYYGLLQCIQSLLSTILSESEEKLLQWRKTLKQALGLNAGLLIDLLPDLELILGNNQTILALTSDVAESRFKHTFINLLRAFAEPGGTLVLHLDDVQWIDQASFKLLSQIVTTAAVPNCLIVACMRPDTEDKSVFDFQALLSDKVLAKHINVSPLAPKYVFDLLKIIFNTDDEKTKKLCEVVNKHTFGNPLYISNFIQYLIDKKFIFVDLQKHEWCWELSAIRNVLPQENLQALIAGRIDRLSDQHKMILTYASCIGQNFDVYILSHISDMQPADTITLLTDIEEYGLIETLFNAQSTYHSTAVMKNKRGNFVVEYRFTHDRIHQYVHQLLPVELMQDIHFKIGVLLLEKLTFSQKNNRIFEIVNHLNFFPTNKLKKTDKVKLQHLNYDAGLKANEATAYSAAETYFKTSITLSDQICWFKQYKNTLLMYTKVAENAYLNNSFDMMDIYLNDILEHAHTIIDSIEAHEIKIKALISQQKPLEAVKYALPVLRSLNIKLPNSPTLLHKIPVYLFFKFGLTKRILTKVRNSDTVSPDHINAAGRIMSTLSSAVYFAKPEIFPFLIFNRMRLYMNHGITPQGLSFLGSFYSALGLVFSGVFEDFERAELCGELAKSIYSENEIGETPKVFMVNYVFIHHWTKPLLDSIDPLYQAYTKCIEKGEIEFASYCLSHHFFHRFFYGKSLTNLLDEMQQNLSVMDQLHNETSSLWYNTTLQTIANLCASSEDVLVTFKDKFFDESTIPDNPTSYEDQTSIACYNFNKMFYALVMSQYTSALDYGTKLNKNLVSLRASYFVPNYYYYFTITLLKCFHTFDAKEKKRKLKWINASIKKFQKWSISQPDNFEHRYLSLYALRASVLGQNSKVVYYFNRALKCLEADAFVNDQAIINELACVFLIETDNTVLAKGYLEKSLALYKHWGAQYKTQHLLNSYGYLLANQTFSIEYASHQHTLYTQKELDNQIDLSILENVTKSISQYGSVEDIHSALLTSVLGISGAKKAIIVQSLMNDHFFAEAIVDVSQPNQVLFRPSADDDRSIIPKRVIQYVVRKQQALILRNPTNHDIFAKDKYIIQNQPKSIFCVPLSLHQKVSFVLYLEHTESTDVFSKSKQSLVTCITHHAILSLEYAKQRQVLENTKENLEHKVQQRTQEVMRLNQLLQNEILEKERNEVTLMAENTVLKETSMAKQNYIEHVSKELIKPINVLNDFLMGMNTNTIENMTRSSLKEMQCTAAALVNDVDHMLDMSRIISNDVLLEYSAVDLYDLLDEVIAPYESLLTLKAIKFPIKIDAGVKSLFTCQYQLKKILNIVINNAIHHTSTGEVKLEVSKIYDASYQFRILFVLSDTGSGITENELIRLFKEQSIHTSEAIRETGIGLDIAKHLAKEIDGDIWAESIVNEGSQFYISIPNASSISKQCKVLLDENLFTLQKELNTENKHPERQIVNMTDVFLNEAQLSNKVMIIHVRNLNEYALIKLTQVRAALIVGEIPSQLQRQLQSFEINYSSVEKLSHTILEDFIVSSDFVSRESSRSATKDVIDITYQTEPES